MNLIFPNKCCVCLGDPDDTMKVTGGKSVSSGGGYVYETIYECQVPVCKSCKGQFLTFEKTATISCPIVAALGLAFGFITQNPGTALWISLAGYATMGGLAGIVLASLIYG